MLMRRTSQNAKKPAWRTHLWHANAETKKHPPDLCRYQCEAFAPDIRKASCSRVRQCDCMRKYNGVQKVTRLITAVSCPFFSPPNKCGTYCDIIEVSNKPLPAAAMPSKRRSVCTIEPIRTKNYSAPIIYSAPTTSSSSGNGLVSFDGPESSKSCNRAAHILPDSEVPLKSIPEVVLFLEFPDCLERFMTEI
jgi:hypothetical protein